MPEAVQNGPIWLLVSFLFCVVFSRAQATYWLGRFIIATAVRTHSDGRVVSAIRRWFNGPAPKRGKRALDRWGVVIIPLSFLTIGFQTAVNAGAGMLQMRWRRYTLAMLPGCIAWAVLYGLGLLAVWLAAINAFAGSWWALLALALIIGLGIVIVRYVKKRSPILQENSWS